MKKTIIGTILAFLLILCIWELSNHSKTGKVDDALIDEICYGEPGHERVSGVSVAKINLGISTWQEIIDFYGPPEDVAVLLEQTGFFPWELDHICRMYFDAAEFGGFWVDLIAGRAATVKSFDGFLPDYSYGIYYWSDLGDVLGQPDIFAYEPGDVGWDYSNFVWLENGLLVVVDVALVSIEPSENGCTKIGFSTVISEITYFEPQSYFSAWKNSMLGIRIINRSKDLNSELLINHDFSSDLMIIFCKDS